MNHTVKWRGTSGSKLFRTKWSRDQWYQSKSHWWL